MSGVTYLLLLLFASHWTPGRSLKCYECTGHVSCGQGQTSQLVSCAGKCMVYRNQYDGDTIVRRCCTNECSGDDSVGTHEGRNPVYFCSEDMCNGEMADERLGSGGRSSSTALVSSTQASSSLSCYECTGHNPSCGTGDTVLVHQCKACMVYSNQFDGDTVIRRCCTYGCGASETISEYEGRKAYFCTSDRCNGKGTEQILTGGASSKAPSTISTPKPPLSCYDCSGTNEHSCTSTTSGCQMCTVTRNQQDPIRFDRRCCWWGCGQSGQVGQLDGRPTYFCDSNQCNGPGAEANLGPSATSSTTVATTRKTSFSCYSCSGQNCGQGDSSLSTDCPSCMVFRSPQDQTIIERRCCWWACGASNTVSTHNGVPTYFCSSDRCNGVGAENALGGPTSTTAKTITTTYSSSTCRLNCQNGGTPETEDGCFCYCNENTSGRECEQIDCTATDANSELCSVENRPLCNQSEIYPYQCLHLCGKC